MGIGPLVAWRRSSVRRLARTVRVPAAVATLLAVAMVAGGAGDKPLAVAGYSFAVFALAAIVRELVVGTRARRSATGAGWLRSAATLVARNRRRYGGYLVHVAVVLLAIGVVGSSLFGVTRQKSLHVGDAMSVGDYTLRLDRSYIRVAANALELRAQLAVFRGGSRIGTVTAGKNRYVVEGETSNEAAIRTDWRRAEDLFVIAEQFDANGVVWLKVLVNPLVDLIWLAGGVFLLGSLIPLWPQRRGPRERRPVDDAQFELLLERTATRDRSLEELRDLEFDHRAGVVTDAEYAALVGGLRHEAASALRALDEVEAR
jgi:cytochrome c-type biogenesis protein CcmF